MIYLLLQVTMQTVDTLGFYTFSIVIYKIIKNLRRLNYFSSKIVFLPKKLFVLSSLMMLITTDKSIEINSHCR